jgi:hypothetical protein
MRQGTETLPLCDAQHPAAHGPPARGGAIRAGGAVDRRPRAGRPLAIADPAAGLSEGGPDSGMAARGRLGVWPGLGSSHWHGHKGPAVPVTAPGIGP